MTMKLRYMFATVDDGWRKFSLGFSGHHCWCWCWWCWDWSAVTEDTEQVLLRLTCPDLLTHSLSLSSQLWNAASLPLALFWCHQTPVIYLCCPCWWWLATKLLSYLIDYCTVCSMGGSCCSVTQMLLIIWMVEVKHILVMHCLIDWLIVYLFGIITRLICYCYNMYHILGFCLIDPFLELLQVRPVTKVKLSGIVVAVTGMPLLSSASSIKALKDVPD